MNSPLGIVAGGGPLPGRLAAACREQGREVFILALRGQADEAAVGPWPHAWIRLGAAGEGIDILRRRGITDLVMVGPIRRPGLAELRPDGWGVRLLARAGARAFGDDGMLAALIGALEEEGFRVHGVQELLGGLLAPEGPLGRCRPDEQAAADIARGRAVLAALSAVDVGQAVVVQQGLVLGIEAIEGTDALVARAGALGRDGPGGVLVKLAKRGQERRADLPTVGPATVRAAARAGLRGIAVEAGGVLVVDRADMAAEADRAGLFVVGIRPL